MTEKEPMQVSNDDEQRIRIAREENLPESASYGDILEARGEKALKWEIEKRGLPESTSWEEIHAIKRTELGLPPDATLQEIFEAEAREKQGTQNS